MDSMAWIEAEESSTTSPPVGETTFQGIFLLLCGFAKFEGQSIFDGEEWVLDGFILGRNWQWCQLKVFPQGNVDFPIDSRRVVLSFLRGKCCWSSLRLVEDYGSNWWPTDALVWKPGTLRCGCLARPCNGNDFS